MSRHYVFTTLFLTLALSAHGQPKLSSAAQALVKIEKEWSEADVKKDVAALNRILADDWVGIDFQGDRKSTRLNFSH